MLNQPRKAKSIAFKTLSMAIGMVLSASAAAAEQYTAGGYLVELLDDLPEGYGVHFPREINDQGIIAGESSGITSEGQGSRAVFWDANGHITDLDKTGQAVYTSAYGLNNQGDIVGQLNELVTAWVNGEPTIFGGRGVATDINDSGLIVGGSSGAFAVRLDGTGLSLPGLGGGSTSARAVNNLNDVTGAAEIAPGLYHATLWRDGAVTDLGVLPGFNVSFGVDINDAGEVVGYSEEQLYSLAEHATLWRDGTITDLGILPGGTRSVASGINAASQVVGRSTAAGGLLHAFSWQDGQMTDLHPVLQQLCNLFTTPGCASTAEAINDAGQIVGRIGDIGAPVGPHGRLRAYRLTPIGAQFDIAAVMTASADAVAEGDTLTYTVTVNNLSTVAASDVSVVDTLPTQVAFVSAVASQGSCSGAATVICSLGNLAASGSAEVTITVTALNAGSATNSAAVSANEVDVVPSNNNAIVSTEVTLPPPPPVVIEADLAVIMKGTPSTVRRGGELNYDITVTNHGSSTAATVVLKDVLPSKLTFVSVTASEGVCVGGSTVTCFLGNLVSGSQATVNIKAIAGKGKRLTNQVTVTSDTSDPDLSNNTASTETFVTR